MYNEYTDTEITDLYHKVAMELSYMNAAEGSAWSAESVARSACIKVYRDVCSELDSRNLDLPKGNYLI